MINWLNRVNNSSSNVTQGLKSRTLNTGDSENLKLRRCHWHFRFHFDSCLGFIKARSWGALYLSIWSSPSSLVQVCSSGIHGQLPSPASALSVIVPGARVCVFGGLDHIFKVRQAVQHANEQLPSQSTRLPVSLFCGPLFPPLPAWLDLKLPLLGCSSDASPVFYHRCRFWNLPSWSISKLLLNCVHVDQSRSAYLGKIQKCFRPLAAMQVGTS